MGSLHSNYPQKVKKVLPVGIELLLMLTIYFRSPTALLYLQAFGKSTRGWKVGLQKLNLLNRTIVFRSSWNECDLPDFCHEKMVLRLGLEADLKVTLELKKRHLTMTISLVLLRG